MSEDPKTYKHFDSKEGEVRNTDGSVCPYCGFLDNEDRYDGEGFHEYQCARCDEIYDCSIHVTLTYTTTVRKKA